MDSSKKKIPDQKPAIEINAAGNPLPSSWIATIAIIWCGQAISIFATVAQALLLFGI